MNDKITLPVIIQSLSQRTGLSKKESEDFIKEFFAEISRSLSEGELIKIKSLGVFKTVEVGARKSVNVATGEEYEIPAHSKIVFVPAKNVAEDINEAFEIFESVELNEDMSTDALEDSSENGPVLLEDKTEDLDSSEPDSMNPTVSEISGAEIDSDESNNSDDRQEDNEVTDNDSDRIQDEGNDTLDDNEFEYSLDDSESSMRHEVVKTRFTSGFFTGFFTCLAACVIAFMLVFFIDWDNRTWTPDKVKRALNYKDNILDSPAKKELPSDSKALNTVTGQPHEDEVATSPSDQQIIDTISTTRYLTTMAKDHYGNYNLWPYIYIENQSFLGHPDRIKPGTAVVVPPLSKYGVDPESQQDIEKAKRKGVEIYSRYK